MVDSGASTNVMPFSVAKKLNAEIHKSEIKIIQLDSSRVQVIGKLRDVLIRLSANPVVHKIIDVIVVHIPEAYGLLLSRDWSKKPKGYFATDWYHLWLPHKGEANTIKVNREPYMKHTVTKLDSPNEAVLGSNGPDGNYCIETFFGNFPTKLSPLDNPTISANYLSSSELEQKHEAHEIVKEELNNDSDVWTMFFDVSKCNEGAGVGCILTSPSGNKNLVPFRLEFECTDNTTEYEALIHRLDKVIDMEVKKLRIFGDSEIYC